MKTLVLNTWSILRASALTLRRNPHLVTLPALAGVPVIGAMTGAMIRGRNRFHECLPADAVLTDNGPANMSDPQAYDACLQSGQWSELATRSLAIALTLWTTFLMAAFVHNVFATFRGRTVSNATSIRTAFSRAPALAAFAILLVALQQLNHLAELPFIYFCCFFSPVAMAWTLLTVLFQPALIQEKRGLLRTLSKSISLLPRTWLPTLGIIVVTSILVLPWLPLYLSGMSRAEGLFLAGHFDAGAAIAVATMAFTLATYSLVLACFGIYSAALYSSLVEGVTPAPFDNESLQTQWRVRTNTLPTAKEPHVHESVASLPAH